MEPSQPGAHLPQDLLNIVSNPPPQISPLEADFDEKHPTLDPFSHRPDRQPSHIHSSQQALNPHSPRPTRPYQPAFTSPAPLFNSEATSTYHSRSFSNSSYSRPRSLRILNLIKSWLPLVLYALTSFGFVVAITLYKTELFERALTDQFIQYLPLISATNPDPPSP